MNRAPWLLAAVLMVTLPVRAEPPLEPVRIGALIVLTGQYAMQGAAFREGAELAVEAINASGGGAGARCTTAPCSPRSRS